MKFNRRKTVGCLVACMTLSSILCQARQLSLQEALQQLPTSSLSTKNISHASPSSIKLLNTSTLRGLNTIYTVENPAEGKIYFLSADDAAAPLLGYCDAAAFDPQSLPPALHDMLTFYSNEIATASENDIIYNPRSGAELSDVAPMLESRWGQNAPYSNLCPSYGNSPTVTGCVATAMAQLMYYHRWPINPIGSISYTWNYQQLSMDFSTITFDWANMLPIYNEQGNYTDAQAEAVALLNQAVAYSVEMSFGSNTSSASLEDTSIALNKYFGYSNDMINLPRALFSLNEWTALIHSELVEQRPVLYRGTNEIGHAFVLDGYKAENDMFHVNWGWNGLSNGYFRITALDPENQGIGGGRQGYNEHQLAVIGIRPSDGTAAYRVYFYMEGEITSDKTEYDRRTDATISFANTDASWFVGNGSLIEVAAQSGVRLTNEATGEQTDIYSIYNESTLRPGYGYSTIPVYTTKFPTSGSYTVELIIKSGNEVYKVLTPFYSSHSMRMVCNGNTISLTPIEVKTSIEASNITLSRRAFAGYNLEFSSTLSAPDDEYYGHIYATLDHGLDRVLTTQSITVDILPGSEMQQQWKAEIPASTAPGSYTLTIYDGYDRAISSPIEVEIEQAPDDDFTLLLNGLTITSAIEGNGSITKPYLIYSDDFTFQATLRNTDGIYRNTVGAYVYRNNTYVNYIGSTTLQIGPGETGVFSMSTGVDGLQIGNTYQLYIAAYTTDGTFLTFPLTRYFRIVERQASAAINSIDAPDSTIDVEGNRLVVVDSREAVAAEIMTTTGQLAARIEPAEANTFSLPPLAPGLYIATIRFADQSSAVHKFIWKQR